MVAAWCCAKSSTSTGILLATMKSAKASIDLCPDGPVHWHRLNGSKHNFRSFRCGRVESLCSKHAAVEPSGRDSRRLATRMRRSLAAKVTTIESKTVVNACTEPCPMERGMRVIGGKPKNSIRWPTQDKSVRVNDLARQRRVASRQMVPPRPHGTGDIGTRSAETDVEVDRASEVHWSSARHSAFGRRTTRQSYDGSSCFSASRSGSATDWRKAFGPRTPTSGPWRRISMRISAS